MYSESNSWKQWFPLTFSFYSAYFRKPLIPRNPVRDFLKDCVKHISLRSKTESLTQSLKSVWLADHWAGWRGARGKIFGLRDLSQWRVWRGVRGQVLWRLRGLSCLSGMSGGVCVERFSVYGVFLFQVEGLKGCVWEGSLHWIRATFPGWLAGGQAGGLTDCPG